MVNLIHKKDQKQKKNDDKDEKALNESTNNAIYEKTMKNLRSRIDIKLSSNKKDYLKWTSKPSYMPQEEFDNDFVGICKNKFTLSSNKPAYIGMCMLGLCKVLMYKFHYDYIKNKYGNK